MTIAATSTVTAMIATDQRSRRQFTVVPVVMTAAYALVRTLSRTTRLARSRCVASHAGRTIR